MIKPASELQPSSVLSDEQFQYELLQGVARTFALTIPQLPKPLDVIVANAYLLCRISDTIEDETGIAADKKLALSKQFIAVVAGDASAAEFADTFHPLLSTQRLAAEKQLVKQIPRVIGITQSFNSRQRAALQRCVTIMSKGMAYFQSSASVGGFSNFSQFNDYCYHVAGVVGEMLTELYCDYSPEMQTHKDKLMHLSISFGQGLQMVNILKDIWEDLDRGVCWLPREIFAESGYDLDRLQERRYEPAFGIGLERMIAITLTHLQNALEYTLFIPKKEKGLRKFCLWAIGMALLTLRKVCRHLDFSTARQVKINKTAVTGTIAVTALAQHSKPLMKCLFAMLTIGLPAPANASATNSHQHIRDWFNARSEL